MLARWAGVPLTPGSYDEGQMRHEDDCLGNFCLCHLVLAAANDVSDLKREAA
jgi:hypothetical protein